MRAQATDSIKKAPRGAAERRQPRRGRPSIGEEHLLDTALDMFLEQGFERTRIEAVAAAAGIAKRTLYQRYRDKESLFRAALARAIEQWVIPVEKLQAAECDDLETTLLQVGRLIVHNVMNPEGLRLLRITNAESIRTPELGAFTYQRGSGRTFAYLADLLQRRIGQANIELDSWDEAAIAFIYLVVCGPPTLTVWGMPLDEETIDRHTRHSVHLFLYGMLPGAEKNLRKAALPPPQEIASRHEADDCARPDDIVELHNENRRLRKLLLTTLLEVESLREQCKSP